MYLMRFLIVFLPFLCSCDEQVKIDYEASYSVDNKDWNTLLSKYVDSSGKVNYQGFKSDSVKLQSYLDLLSENHPSKSWSNNEVKSYWINVYNAFTIKLILDHYPVNSIKDIGGNFSTPWKIEFIKIQENLYSLQYIEHEILRKMDDPRIHFAIVCASYSCPSLRNEAFSPSHLDEQLNAQATFFINNNNKNILSENKIELSKIFDWFESDFTNDSKIVQYIQQYSKIKINTEAHVSYLDYNWNLNE
jgi:hypothetical protein